ncbi:MAG: flagellar assembly peptidoglycan hydrolase FlgJ [Candidatus Polarisedimenticolaceae bacterium]|nr:flagellar assembly peptidoglycan hydrolase FlgJ [Candidatus Polarisedimenticolaceae bacterium]
MTLTTANVYTDFQGLTQLKAAARQDQEGSLDEVARQFESLLTQMMVKSMREASAVESDMDSDQSLFYRDMYDKQLSLHLSQGNGMGLSEVIKRQLTPAEGLTFDSHRGIDDYHQRPVSRAYISPMDQPQPEPQADVAETAAIDGPESFVQQLWPQAEKAAAELGLPVEALLAQAALESGWGGQMIRHANGDNSHNLFGIKADSRWEGERVAVSTLEYEQGIAVRKKAFFRAYDSFEASFSDYADFVKTSPRYVDAQRSSNSPDTYFRKLQHAGYATDPAYSEKVMRVMRGPEMLGAVNQFKTELNQPKQI